MFARLCILSAMLLSIFAVSNLSLGHADHPREQEKLLDKSVIRLVSEDGGHGTGFATMYKNKLVILTNAHVCEGYSHLYSRVGKTRYKHKVMRISTNHDICMVQGLSELRPLLIADKAYRNQTVYSMGYPLAEFKVYTQGKLKGIKDTETPYILPVEKCHGRNHLEVRLIPDRRAPFGYRAICMMSGKFYFTTLRIDQGASGSPVVNSDGDVVGIISIMEGNIAFGMAVPHYEVKAFLEE